MQDNGTTRLPELLLVEDNVGDARLFEEALRANNFECNLSTVVDGEFAIRYLAREAPYDSASTPDIILLDLNLPRKDGRAVLREIKTDERFAHLRSTPVIVLSTSSHDKDIADCYDHYANCYIVKPMNIRRYFEIVDQINAFWFSVVELPRH